VTSHCSTYAASSAARQFSRGSGTGTSAAQWPHSTNPGGGGPGTSTQMQSISVPTVPDTDPSTSTTTSVPKQSGHTSSLSLWTSRSSGRSTVPEFSASAISITSPFVIGRTMLSR
jgi:hypothetical protein